MGTNFYAKRIPTQADLEKVSTATMNGKLDEAMEMLAELNERVHICKRSGGWKMSFDHNDGRYYEPNRKSLEEYLSKSDIQIVDEYGTEYSWGEFWKMVDEWNTMPNNFRDSEFVYREDPSTYICREDIAKCKRLFGIETKYNDFTDKYGLRFCVYTGFC